MNLDSQDEKTGASCAVDRTFLGSFFIFAMKSAYAAEPVSPAACHER